MELSQEPLEAVDGGAQQTSHRPDDFDEFYVYIIIYVHLQRDYTKKNPSRAPSHEGIIPLYKIYEYLFCLIYDIHGLFCMSARCIFSKYISI